ncbi:hypothetical protein ABPG74_012962 [Tetrahymena malaccensis]
MKKNENEQSEEKIMFQETFQNVDNNNIQEHNMFDFSILSQQESIVNQQKTDDQQKEKVEINNNEQLDASKNEDNSQSMNLSLRFNPINMQAMVKRDALTPKRQRFSNRKITKKEINFINTIINRSQFNNGNTTNNKIDKGKMKMQNLASYFQLDGDKNIEPSYFKLLSFIYVYKFLKRLLTKLINQNICFLSDLQMKIINDKSYFANGIKLKNQQEVNNTQKHNNIFERLLNLRKQQNPEFNKISKQSFKIIKYISTFTQLISRLLFKSFAIINPNNFMLKLWDLIYLLLFFAVFLTYPFYLSFIQGESQQLPKQIIFTIQIIQVASSLFDILLTSQTGIYVFGEIVLKREIIYKQYFSKLFIQDMLCILVQLLGILTGYGFPNFFAILFRIETVNEKFSRMNWHRKLKQKLSSFYDLIKLLSFLLVVIHIFGCGFYYVGYISVKSGLEDTNWIIKNNIQNSNVFDQYIRSIYFITITMVTIGYGDITPVNSIEIIYSLFISFITCGLFGYCINFIGSIFTELSKKSKEFQKKLLVITKYLNSRNIDQSNQIRVLKYLEYLDESQEENILEGYNILNSCSKDIKEDIMKQFYGTVIKKSRLFKDTFSKEFIESLSLKMQERCFAPGETIIERGQKLESLYFITRGQTEYFYDKKDQKNSICIFENQVIDLRIFMIQQKSDISIRSKGITVVSYFDHQTFLNTICQHQDDYERYIQLRDQFLNDQRFQYPCRSCGQYKHNIFDCPQITLQVDKSAFLKKYRINYDQERIQENKRRTKKFQSLSQIQVVKKKLKLARYNIISNLIDGYESLKNTSTFFENNDDKEFFMLLPKINCIKLIESYKKNDENLQKQTSQKIQTEGLINVKNIQFADDILQYTDSLSSDSSSSSDSSDNSSSEQSLDENDQKLGSKSQTSRQSCGNKFESVSNQRVIEENYTLTNLEEENKTTTKIQADDDILNQNNRYFQKEIINSFASQVSQDFTRGHEYLKNNSVSNYNNNKNLPSFQNDENNILEYSNTSDFRPRKQRVEHKHNSLIQNQQSLSQSKYKNSQYSSTNIPFDVEEINKSTDKNTQQKQSMHLKQFKQGVIESLNNNTPQIMNQNYVNNSVCNSNNNNINNTEIMNLQKNFIDQMKYILSQLEQNQINQKQTEKQELKEKIHKQSTLNTKTERRKSKMIAFNLNSQIGSYILKSQSNSRSTVFDKHQAVSFQNPIKDIVDYQTNFVNYQKLDYQQTNSFGQQNSDCLFGKCGFYFDAVKEYQHYYPKFNYNCVIKAYRRQKQFQIKNFKQISIKQNEQHMNIKQQKTSYLDLTNNNSQIKLNGSFS